MNNFHTIFGINSIIINKQSIGFSDIGIRIKKFALIFIQYREGPLHVYSIV